MTIIQANPGFRLAIALNADHSDEWRLAIRHIVAWDIDADDPGDPCPTIVGISELKNWVTSIVLPPDETVPEEWLNEVKNLANSGAAILDPWRCRHALRGAAAAYPQLSR
jgi:hypothetical protein